MSRVFPPWLHRVLPVVAAIPLLVAVGFAWWSRLGYPFDLVWTEGGTLAHAWRLQHGMPLYVPPGPDFVPFPTAPGYPALLAAAGQGLGLSPMLGRGISALASLAAAAAIVVVVVRRGGGRAVGVACAAIYLGTTPYAEAFHDVVAPHATGTALLAWAVALGLERSRGAAISAGLLLAAAATVQLHLAGFAVPMALGIAAMGGRWRALRFGLAFALPFGALVAWWQWRSGGAFATYLFAVPLAHPFSIKRAWLFVPRETGTPLPFVWIALGVWGVILAMGRQRRIHPGTVALASVWAGMGFAWLGTFRPPGPDAIVYNLPSAAAFWALATLACALPLWGIGARGLPGRVRYAAGIGATAVGIAAVQRANGGSTMDVYLPLFWILAVGGGWAATAAVGRYPTVVTGGLVLQLGWSWLLFDGDRLRPRQSDLVAGRIVVAAIGRSPEPTLSPFAAWLPVYVGRPPSLHYHGMRRLRRPRSPWSMDAIEAAVAERHWGTVIGGNHRFVDDLTDHYRQSTELVPPPVKALMPKTGWTARPWRRLKPRARSRGGDPQVPDEG